MGELALRNKYEGKRIRKQRTETLDRSLRDGFYLDLDGDPARLTASSDASISSPQALYEQIRDFIINHRFAIELVLRLVTSNTARVLKLAGKGSLASESAADVLVHRQGSLELREVIAGGN